MMQYWIGFSEEVISDVEQKLFSKLKTAYNTFYVPIVLDGTEEKIWTISLNTKSQKTPLVLLHGYASGMALWCLNLDYLAKDRPVYAMDIIGFGRSSRSQFSENGAENEKKIITSIEEWRKYLKLDSFFLLGHSMGGYLAMSYTLSYSDRVKLLLLCDPWGFSDNYEYFDFSPLFVKLLSYLHDVLVFNPLTYLRCLGPFGPIFIWATRDDINKHFRGFLNEALTLPTYIYQCNAHPNPTGETAFYSFVTGIGWSKSPMIQRINNLSTKIPIKIMYGSNTWVDKEIGQKIKQMRPNSWVGVEIIKDAAHHIMPNKLQNSMKLLTLLAAL